MKVDRREKDKRKGDRRKDQLSFEGKDRRIEERRVDDRRHIERSPIYVWYLMNKKSLQIYAIILIVSIFIALTYIFMGDIFKSFTEYEDRAYQPKDFQREEYLLRKEVEEKKRLLEELQKRR